MEKRNWLYLITIIQLSVLISTGCKKENTTISPEVSTVGISLITPVSAACNAIVTISGNQDITITGVCWSKIPSATVSDHKTALNNVSGSQGFRSDLTGLEANTTYFARAYVLGLSGISYGNELSFTTPEDHTGEQGTVSDIQGNVYKTLGIGSQIWTAENLKSYELNDGSNITMGKCYRCWGALTAPGYCVYNNEDANRDIYGTLYNWYTVSSNKICPTGWHVPQDEEWTILETFLNGKSAVDALSILPGGFRGELGAYTDMGKAGYFWTSSLASSDKANYLSIGSAGTEITRGTYSPGWGASVRCIKN
jgi:hypothetical protein